MFSLWPFLFSLSRFVSLSLSVCLGLLLFRLITGSRLLDVPFPRVPFQHCNVHDLDSLSNCTKHVLRELHALSFPFYRRTETKPMFEFFFINRLSCTWEICTISIEYSMLMYVDTRCYSSGSRGTVRKEREQKQTRRKMAKEEQQQQQHRKKAERQSKNLTNFAHFVFSWQPFSHLLSLCLSVCFISTFSPQMHFSLSFREKEPQKSGWAKSRGWKR